MCPQALCLGVLEKAAQERGEGKQRVLGNQVRDDGLGQVVPGKSL